MTCRLQLENVRVAARTIDPVFLNTPQFVSESLSAKLGMRIVVKIETLNPVRCFKGRGADYFVSKLPRGERLLTASAGNFGQAMAYACRRRGVALTVYASTRANAFKVERMRALGAEVILAGEDFDAAKLEAKRAAARSGVRMVEDGFDVETGEGAGTIGLELAAWPEPFDVVLLNLGNGALACGAGCCLKRLSSRTRIVAVQATGAPAMVESWRQGRVISYETIATIADGIGIRVPIPECVDDMQGTIDDALLVKDETVLAAMRLAHEHLGLVIEPSAAVGIAALLENQPAFAGKIVGVVITGGNLTPAQMRDWLS